RTHYNIAVSSCNARRHRIPPVGLAVLRPDKRDTGERHFLVFGNLKQVVVFPAECHAPKGRESYSHKANVHLGGASNPTIAHAVHLPYKMDHLSEGCHILEVGVENSADAYHSSQTKFEEHGASGPRSDRNAATTFAKSWG